MITRYPCTGCTPRLLRASLLVILAGCAGPGPKLFPVTASSATPRPEGGQDLLFDTDSDGRDDYVERQGSDGLVALLGYDEDGDGQFERKVPAPARLRDPVPHVVIVLDSIPFDLVRGAWERGRFRAFHPPSRVISPFPVMTDISLTAFFGVAPSLAVESQFYDGTRLNTGYGTYARETISHWHAAVDYHLAYASHSAVYFRPNEWFGHELRRVQQRLAGDTGDLFLAYLVGTSAIGAQLGHDGHLAALARLDRFCRWLIHRRQGRVHITLMSDHGHNNVRSRRIDLPEGLRRAGYHVTKRLKRPGDVVVPGFGIVTYAGIHTAEPHAVAADVVGLEGIHLAAYCDGSDEVVVLSRDGQARISRQGDAYRYLPERGDPLELRPVLAGLTGSGKVDPDGFVADQMLFDATADHPLPDAVHRLWRAFHGQTVHTPDVLLSVEDGYYCGSGLMSELIDLRSAHGSLNRISSSGFIMSTAGRVDPVIRMEDLREALTRLAVPFDPPERSWSGGLRDRR